MSRRTARRQRFYARMRIARSTPPWYWYGADPADLLPLGSIESLVTLMRTWLVVSESITPEPDTLW